jgi:hypothetical protein
MVQQIWKIKSKKFAISITCLILAKGHKICQNKKNTKIFFHISEKASENVTGYKN